MPSEIKFITINGDVYLRVEPWWYKLVPYWHRLTHWALVALTRI